jgi:hypothetical protein
VNGKALVNGIRLGELDAPDMVDIIHFFFEEDSFRYESGEQAEAVSKGRAELYKMYGTTYTYGVSGKRGNTTRKYVGKDSGFDFEDNPFDDVPKPVKPYIPPTQFDPDSGLAIDGALDAPLR